jgi:ureidoglycolate lyase
MAGLTEVPVLAATRDSVAAYGLFIGTDVPDAGLAIPFYAGAVEEGHNFPFVCNGPAVVRSARIHRRDAEVVWLERHLNMTQLFIGLGDQPFAMVVGRPNHELGEDLPRLDELCCFVFPPGHGFMLHIGTWHDFPLCVDQPVTVLTMNSSEVVEALATMVGPAEMAHGDVYKLDVRARTERRVVVPL